MAHAEGNVGKLSAIQITTIHATTTDDWSTDHVYYFSTIRCGNNDGVGNMPPSSVPAMTGGQVTKSTAGVPMEVAEGVDAHPHTPWGFLYPNSIVHEDCCVAGEGMVSGSIYFLDSEELDRRWLFFGLIVGSLMSLGVAVFVPGALLLTGALAGLAAGASGAATGVGFAVLWDAFLKAISHDNYLGGVRVQFPCEGTGEVVQTHNLAYASALTFNLPSGNRGKTVPGSRKAKYSVTIRAKYS